MMPSEKNSRHFVQDETGDTLVDQCCIMHGDLLSPWGSTPSILQCAELRHSFTRMPTDYSTSASNTRKSLPDEGSYIYYSPCGNSLHFLTWLLAQGRKA